MNLTETTMPSVEPAKTLPETSAIRERAAVRWLGPGMRVLAALVLILAIPQLASQVATVLTPPLAKIDPDSAFLWLSLHHLAQIPMTLGLMPAWSSSPLSGDLISRKLKSASAGWAGLSCFSPWGRWCSASCRWSGQGTTTPSSTGAYGNHENSSR